MSKMVGSRHRCEQCGTEVIVVIEGSAELGFTCCGSPLTVTFTKEGGSVAPAQSAATESS